MILLSSFPPIVDTETEILILGTMPGAMSLQKQEYYAHKQNQFWKILFTVFDNGTVPELFHEKREVLQQNKIDGARIYQVLKRHEDNVVGFDVSEYQGEINWEEVDSVEMHQLHYVFIRATAGSDKVDSKFKENWKQAQKTKLIVVLIIIIVQMKIRLNKPKISSKP